MPVDAEVKHHKKETANKKQCSRQLQCEVPCGVSNAVNSSLFNNSSLSSLSSTSHAACCPWGGPASSGGSHLWQGGSCLQQGEGVWYGGGGLVGEGGQGAFLSSCHTLHYHMVLLPKGTSHNEAMTDKKAYLCSTLESFCHGMQPCKCQKKEWQSCICQKHKNKKQAKKIIKLVLQRPYLST